jgi:hypothetical protein
VDGGIVDPPALDEDVTLSRFFQSGDHPQNRCFAAPRWTQEGDQRTVRNIQIDFMDRNHFAKVLGYTPELNCRRSIAVCPHIAASYLSFCPAFALDAGFRMLD